MEHQTAVKTNQAPQTQGAAGAKPDTNPFEAIYSFRDLHQRIGNRAVGRLVQANLKVSGPIQCKLRDDSASDPWEREADSIADDLLDGQRLEIRPSRPASSANAISSWPIASDRFRDVEAGLSGGEQLSPELRRRFEPALGMDLRDLRIHRGGPAELAAEALGAQAFTAGSHVVFGAGQYSTTTSTGLRLLAHELAHVAQQSGGAAPQVQRHNAADPRLPADQAEALTFAAQADTEIQGALTRLVTAPDRLGQNIPAFVAQHGLVLRPLTPRHDSPVAASDINFFPGFLNYSGSVTVSALTEYLISPDLMRLSIRAREHADIDNMLHSTAIDNLVVRAVAEVAELLATTSMVGGLTTFDRYRARFNALYVDPSFLGLSDDWIRTPTWGSHGPPSLRAHSVFQTIYDSSAPFKTAYDTDIALKELVDSYLGPNSLNPLASPRLQRLREAFFPSPVPITTAAQHTALLTRIQTVSPTLMAEDRTAVAESNAWERLINDHELVTGNPTLTADRRREIVNAIANPPAPTPTPPVPTTPGAPPGGGAGACTPQSFVDSVTLTAPASITATDSQEALALVPAASCPNPGVSTSSRITLSPAGSVIGSAVDTQPWPNNSADGAVFMPDIRVSTGLRIDAQLDLVGGPARTAPIPLVQIPVQDNRQTNMASVWQPEVSFNNGQFTEVFNTGDTVRYISGSQTFSIAGTMPAHPGHNPQLAVSVEAEILRGAAIIAGAQSTPWPMAADRTATISLSFTPPTPFPASGLDTLTVQTRLRDSSGAVIAGSARTVTIDVGPEATYSQTAAQDVWTRDLNFYLNDPTNLVGLMAASTNAAHVGFADMVTNGLLTFHPSVIRHDSASYVTQAHSNTPDPTQHAWLVNTPPYGPHPDLMHTKVAPTSWAAMSNLSFAGVTGPFVVVNRTPDVSDPTTVRTNDELMMLAVHEAVHEFDFAHHWSPIEDYRTEFRAYWMDGRFGPPDQATVIGHPEQSANFDPDDPQLHPPGPQSRRANTIFHLLYDDPVGYGFVRNNYDNNINHFREQVDAYLIPDGINLLVSRRLELLRRIVDAGPGASFATYRDNILAFFGQGPLPAPAAGVLTSAELDYIRSSRQWRDHFFLVITNVANRTALLNAMGIPL